MVSTWSSMFIVILLISVLCLCSVQQTEAKWFSGLKSAVKKVRSSVSDKVKSVKSKVEKTVNKVKSTANKVKSNVTRRIAKTIPKPLRAVTNKVKRSISNKTNKWKSKFNTAKSIVKRGANKIKSGANKLKNKLKGKASKLKNKLKSGASKLKNKVKNGASKLKRKSKELKNKLKGKARKLKNKLKNSKIGKKISKKVKSVKNKLRKAGAKVDKIFKGAKKKLAAKIKKVSTNLKNKVMKKLEILKKAGGKLKGTKVWKEISKQLKKAKTVISAIKNSKKNDQTTGVTKLGSLKNLKGNAKVSSMSSISAKTVSIASQMSNNAYEKSSDKNLEKQGYQVILHKDHKKEMVASKVYYNPQDKTLVVAYRGTVSTSLKDWGNNLKIGLKPAYFDGKYAGKVHSGFLNNYMTDRDEINKVIAQYQKEGKVEKIVFTGHSKGGALSEIAATDYQLNNKNNGVKVELVTFGGPRVGDKKHAEIVNENVKDYVRVVNTYEKKGKTKKDLVSEIPPKLFGYAHAGAEVQLGCGKSGGVSCHLLDNYLPNTTHQ